MATGLSKTKWQNNKLTNTSLLDSKISLFYEGKKSEESILTTPPGQFRLLWSGGVLPFNQLFWGDNLPVLASFIHNSDVCGKIRLIYIDPPFATKSIFQSRSQTDAYTDLLSGAGYLEFMRERLVFLRELLADDGSIYVHLDNKMASYMKVIMDEVFGVNNFRNWITRKKCNPKNYTRKSYGNVSDFILFYTKSENYVWNRPFTKWTNEKANEEYTYVEEETGRRYKKVPLHAPGVRNGATGQIWRGMSPPPGKHWQFPPETLDEMDTRGEIYWSANGNPRRKIYLDESPGIPVQDIWVEFRDAHNQNIEVTGYPTEKNPELLQRIIKASSNPGDVVLDCFSGSGTTLAVASQLHRKWIGIDNGIEAINTTLRRFVMGSEPMGDFVNNRQPIPAKPEPLPLFQYNNSFEPVGSPTALTKRSVKAIQDFSLYALEPYQNKLEEVIQQWL